jgi:outer membrane protein assembly factor BamB
MPWLRSLAGLFLLSTLAAAADWPQWLGPTRDGVSTEKVAPWKEAPKVLWRQPVGDGHSSPVVAEGKVFVHAKVKDKDQEELLAFDAKTGKPLWQTAYDRGKFESKFGNGPRATPTVSGGKVYTFGVTGILSCFEAEGGKKVWQEDTLKKFKAANLFFGASCSPLLEGDLVLVNVGGKGASIVAFNKDKGDIVWQTGDDRASYSSPIAFGQGKERQVVFLTQQGLLGLAPADGSVFWKFPLVDTLSESSTTPVRLGDLLVGSSVTVGSVGLKLETKDGKPAASEAWKNPALTCYFSTPVAVGKDHLYMVTGSIFGSAALRCVEVKTGKELWSKPKVGKYHAALMRTGDDKLLMLDDDGNLMLLEPNAKEYKELARAKVAGAPPIWAHPALSDGKLFVRDAKELICVQLGQ